MSMRTPTSNEPPRWVQDVLRLFLKRRDRETVVGDLLEEYREAILPARGPFRARLWYVRQALGLVDGLALGTLLGVGFGTWILVYTRLAPLADDTPLALASFYGPMFTIWSGAAFSAYRRTGQFSDALKVGATVGCATIVILDISTLLRANLFLDTISQRSDWRGLVMNYRASGFESLTAYVNYTYVTQIPLTILIGAAAGAMSGLIAALAGSLTRQRADPLPSH